MTVINAIILGLIRGAAEFLPISASGHMSIVQNLFGLSAGGASHALFDFLLRLGGLIALCVVMREDLIGLFNDCVTMFTTKDAKLRDKSRLGTRQVLMLMISMLPLLGILPIYGSMEELQSHTVFVGLLMILTGCMLYVAGKFLPGKKDGKNITLLNALIIGVCQIFTGMAVSMYRKIKKGEVMDALCSEGAWYLVFILLGAGFLLGQMKIAGIAVIVLLVVTQSYGKKGLVGKFMGVFGSLYNNITGYFSDILSYSRLMALMLAGAVIAQVFNTLGALTGNVITFFIISMVGNALNFALNLLGCYVHDMRLQCLEYFGRFYEDGGKPFHPLDMKSKYYRIVK